MRILIITPLYPPDVSEPALYAKELATRLKDRHEVTIATYGGHREQIDGVEIHTVNKERRTSKRVRDFRELIEKLSVQTNIALLLNGPSSELPGTIALRKTKTPFLFHIIDDTAYKNRKKSLKNILAYFLSKLNAKKNVENTVLKKPEILPFEDAPDMGTYEESWKVHIQLLEEYFATYARNT